MTSNLMSAWSYVGGVLLAIFILLVMITVHEFGHYLAGKILRFRIDEFSIGFGPAFFKKKSKKTGEVFSLRLIPLGGYCAFHGEDGEEEKPDPFIDGPSQDKAKNSSENQDEVFPDHAEQTSEKASEKASEQASKQEKTAAGSSQEETSPAEGAAEKPEAPKGGSFPDMACWKRIIVLVSGALMNYLLALFLILVCFFAFGQSYVEVKFSDGLLPQEESFCEGDILIGGGGKNFYLTNDIGLVLNGKKKGDVVVFKVLRRNEEGKYIRTEQPVRLRGDVTLKNSSDFHGVWSAIGAGTETREDGEYYAVQTARYRFGFFTTVGHSFAYSYKIAGSILRVIGELFTGRLGLEAFGGPVTTIRTTAAVASQGFASFLEIAALIGVNLAVFNLLPVPALDGCKVVFTVIEWIRKKPISRKVEAIIHAVGFVLLIGFAILVDILQFV